MEREKESEEDCDFQRGKLTFYINGGERQDFPDPDWKFSDRERSRSGQKKEKRDRSENPRQGGRGL